MLFSFAAHVQLNVHNRFLFCVSDRYLGDQRFSYSRTLSFTLRVGEDGVSASVNDVIIEGGGVTVRAPIYAQVPYVASGDACLCVIHVLA